FPFIYEHEPSYNQNYDVSTHGPKYRFFDSDQIQNPQYPDVQENPPNDEFEACTNSNNDKMNNLEIEFNQLHTQDFQKNCDDFQMRNFMQNFHDGLLIPPPGEDKEPEATADTGLPSTEDIQPLPVREPPQNSNIHQLIREECCVEVPEQQKQKMEDTMFEFVKICQEKEFLCIYDDVDDLIESSLDSKLLLINLNSQHLDKKEQEVKNVVEQPAKHGNRNIQSLQNFKVVHKSSISFKNTSQISSIHSIAPIQSTKEPRHSLSMGYEHLIITPETESDEVTKSNAENLLPIPSKCEVTLKDEIECDMPSKDDCSLVFTNFSNPLFKDDDNFHSSNDESLPDEDVLTEEFKIYSNSLFYEDEINFDKLDPHCFNVESDVVESLLNRDTFINFSSKFDFYGELAHIKPEIPKSDFDFEEEIRLIENLLYDNLFPRPPEELNAEIANTIIESIPLLPILVQDGEADLFLSDNSITSEPPDAETDVGEEFQDVMIDKDKFDDDYKIFMFDKVFSLLSAESEDTIFDPVFYLVVVLSMFMVFKQNYPLEIEVILCRIYVRFPKSSYPLIDFSLGKSISF
nr:hypothetical protein [Tanacetum cinerariifolium]